jgi:hypothetical protein
VLLITLGEELKVDAQVVKGHEEKKTHERRVGHGAEGEYDADHQG